MKHKGNLIITKENQKKFKKLTEVSGYVDVRENATFDAPNLQKSGSVYVRENATFDAPKLTEVSGYVYVRENATFDAPKLTEVSGYVDVRENATFDAPKLKIAKNIARFNNKDHKILHKDNKCFLSESERTSKGIKVYKGYLNIKIENGKVIGEEGFLTEKTGFYAHGKNLKLAISDLQFKIASERIKKEPITENTELTVMHYRTITGACDIGVRHFMEENGIPFNIENDRTVEEKPIKAKDLLPILERKQAYGLEKFKSLITF